MEIPMFAHFILGDAVSKLETFVWILNHILRSITWSLFTLKDPKSIILRQMTNLNIDFLPQFPAEFGNGQFVITDFPARNNCNHGNFTDNENKTKANLISVKPWLNGV